ncbi:MAG TPA: type 4b pilus protein PilO2 [Burkholderiaceae bacterium]
MTTHVTQIGKHRFVCGLFWQSLSRPRDLMKEAAELAKRIDCDLVVLRKDHATAQAGFGSTREFSRRTSYSLGAAVSKTMAVQGAEFDGQKQSAHNWLGAFKLPDGKWAYFAVRDANFLPNGDFAGSKEEVLDHLNNDYGMGGWNIVIGDPELESFGFHNFMPKKIEDMIPRKKGGQIEIHTWWTLRPLSRRFPWRPAAVGMAALLVTGAGFAAWRYDERKKVDEMRQRALQDAALASKGQPGQTDPWLAAAKPKSLANACIGGFGYLTAGGWRLDDYLCTPAGASFMWSRQESTVGFLLAEVPDASVDLNGNKAALLRPLHVPPGGQETLLARKDLIEPIITRLQLLDISPKITRLAAPPPPAGPKGASMPPPKLDWESYAFTFNAGSLPPGEVAEVLNRPGIRLSKLTYHTGEWSFEGVMYAKLP